MVREHAFDKLVEWSKRYMPAEIGAIIGVLTGGFLIHYLFHNAILTALGGTWGECIGYYGVIISRDAIHLFRKIHKKKFSALVKLLRNLIIEFGPAEYLDSFLIRPAALYFFPNLIHNIFIGLVIGKLVADVIFYIPTIFFYEIRKKYLYI